MDHDRVQALTRKLRQAETAMNGIAAEIGGLAGKTDPVSNAIRDRLTGQFSQRYDEKTSIQADLQAIQDAAPLPDSDLTLIDELPYAPGLLAQAPDDLRERLAAAFGLQAIYRPDTRQATIVLTITDTTPGTIAALLTDPRIDDDTATNRPPQTEPASPPTSGNASVDVSDTAIAKKSLRDHGNQQAYCRPVGSRGNGEAGGVGRGGQRRAIVIYLDKRDICFGGKNLDSEARISLGCLHGADAPAQGRGDHYERHTCRPA